jgi:hypothetical protein
MEYMEMRLQTQTMPDVVGLRGHRKKGGTSVQQELGVLYMVSVLIIPDITKLDLVVNKKYLDAYNKSMARFGGREGRVQVPPILEGDSLPKGFVVPPQDDSGAFVLGGQKLLRNRPGM